MLALGGITVKTIPQVVKFKMNFSRFIIPSKKKNELFSTLNTHLTCENIT